MSGRRFIVHSDGASRGNPGPAGAGYIVTGEAGEVVTEGVVPIGIATNNIAEYTGVFEAAKFMRTLKPGSVEFRLDSELIVKQLKGEYRVKDPNLKVIYLKLRDVLSDLTYTVTHVPRAQNKHADLLANRAVDAWLKDQA